MGYQTAVQSSLSLREVFDQFNQAQVQLQTFFDAPLDLLCCLNREGKFQAASFSWLQTLGWREDELQGHYWGEWVHPQDMQHALLQLNSLLNQRSNRKQQYRFDCRFRHRDGSYRWLMWRLVLASPSRSIVYAWVQDITEQKMSEPQGFEYRDEFLQLAETLRDVFWIYDPLAHQQLYVSPSYERVWGRSCDSLYQDPSSLHAAIHPEDQDYVRTVLDDTQHTVLTGANQAACSDLEYRIVQPNGEVRWIHDRSFPLLDSTGQIYRFIGVAEDITEQRQAEEECDRLFAQITQQNQTLEQRIAQRTDELRAIIDAIPDQICVVTRPDMRIDYCNAAFVEALNAPNRQALEGKTIYECFPAAQAEYSAQQNEQVFATGLPLQIEESLVLGNWASLLHLDTTKVPLRTPEGEVYALVSAARDISAFKIAEAELQKSQELFRAIFEQAAVGISLVSPEGKFIAVNQKFCSLLGYSQAELMTMTFQQITDPHHLEADLNQYHRLLNGEIQSFSLEKCFIRKDQGLQWAALTVSGVYDDGGEMKYDIGVLQDISDRKQGEVEVLKALAKERELNELKSRVISMISHEYRTPLTVIYSSAELLEHYGDRWTDERRRTHFERIQNSVNHLTELVNDVLFLNRAEADRLDFNPAPLDVVGFFQKLLPEIQDAFFAQENCVHSLRVMYPEGRPILSLDERLLRQIVTNLFSNAVKYSPQGCQIEINIRYVNDELQLVIEDRGIGIPEEEQGKLFDSFRRAGNVGTIPGTGLGLSIVKKCVDIHQGRIKVRSQVNQGTRFSIALPSFRG